FRFSPEKRPLLWLETAAAVANRIGQAQFVLFGRGEMQAEMEQAAERLGLKNRLVFAGVTTDVLDALSAMDVVFLTSALEALPNVLLEAAWAGTAVVGTRAGGAPEAVEEGLTGWIVDPATADRLAERIQWLHANPRERAAVRDRGPAFVKREFSLSM